jgi:hypothetical protein
MFDGRAYCFSTTHYDFGTRTGAAAAAQPAARVSE